jgi:hypothetical protein
MDYVIVISNLQEIVANTKFVLKDAMVTEFA